MRAMFYPSTCSECHQGIRYAPAQEAPGGFVWGCVTEGCPEYGHLYQLPELEARPFIQAALLRPKMRLA